ncbi:glycosyltransferase family 61 protein [Mumia sp. Pv 4-285]|uniref:glycosyltransferase family 61 protein n=1 Tax=Mumia qirimensis TaxID=3234852 RepID=UPI00351D18AB
MAVETLDDIGRRRGARQSSDGLGYLDAYERELAKLGEPPATIVLALRRGGADTASTFAERFPAATVHLLAHGDAAVSSAPDAPLPPNVVVHPCRAGKDQESVLLTIPRPELLVLGYATRPGRRVGGIRRLHGYVAAGGLLAVEQVDRAGRERRAAPSDTSARSVLAGALAKSVLPLPARGWTTWHDALALTLADVRFYDDLALATKRATLTALLRTADAAPVLAARFGDDNPLETLARRPSQTFTARGRIRSHGKGPAVIEGGIAVPGLELRRYDDVLAYPRQRVRYDDYWLPDTFRHQHAPRLRHRSMIRSGNLAATLPAWEPTTEGRWDGALYYLDTEFPGHFGHVCTEVVSRLWGWDLARREHPDLRPVVSLRRGQKEPPPFLRTILDAYGIDNSTLVVQPGDQALRVETLYAADPEFENPRFVAPQITETWERIGAGLEAVVPPIRSERIFIARGRRRSAREAAEIEAFFARHGFAILRPEHHPFDEQVALFAQARIIAGYGGSGMFTMAYAPCAKVILISGDGYLAQNEALIAAARGQEVHYFWGRTLRSAPDPTKDRVVFADDFTFDLRRRSRALRRLMR